MEQLQDHHGAGEGCRRGPSRRRRPNGAASDAPPSARPGDPPGAAAWAGSAPTRGPSDSSVHPAGMALIQGTAYRARRRMQRMTGSGTRPSTDRPSARQLPDLRAGDRHLGPVDPFGPPRRGNVRHRARGPGDDGQGHQALEVLARGARTRDRRPGRPRRPGRARPGWPPASARISSAVSTE